MAIIPTFFFLYNIDQEKFFYDILQRKNAFLGYKSNKFKKSKNWHMAIIPNLIFLRNIAQENVFYDILKQKNAFLGYKNNNFKKSKNGHYSNFFFCTM